MNYRILLSLLILSSALTAAIGAPPEGKRGKGPPPWAPAHGLRAKYSYHYYPGVEVYHRPSDGLWFYYENGRWTVGARLPSGIEVSVSRAVTLEMDTDKPYAFHRDVKAAYAVEAMPSPGKPTKSKAAAK